MKKSILCILAATLAMVASATPVTPRQAKQAARAWAHANVAFVGESADIAGSAVAVTNADGVTLWYRVPLKNGSCLAVSPVTELEPVVACLENVGADGLPAAHPMRAMLARDMADRLRKLGLYEPMPASNGPSLMGATPGASSGTATIEDPVLAGWADQGRAKWARLTGGAGGPQLLAAVTNGVDNAGMTNIVRVVDGFEKGGRLTHWNQGTVGNFLNGDPCYNYYTPNNYPCGCVATAMAALLQFYEANATKAGLSGVSGNCKVDGSEIEALTMSSDLAPDYDFYDWSLVKDFTWNDYRNPSKMTKAVREMLGRVTYDAGVMLSMSWAASGSGAQESDIARALPYFQKVDIESETHVPLRACAVNNPTESQYEKLVYFPCRAGQPVGLGIRPGSGGEGHSVLAVGYGKDDEGNERVRIFTGWGGVGDGWYALPYIDTKSLPSDAGHYLFDVIHTVVTMIGYEDRGRVPLVGRVMKSGVNTLTASPMNETVPVARDGYFGLCIPTFFIEVALRAANGTEAIVWPEVDALAGMSGVVNGRSLCQALPDEIFVEDMNCKEAYSFRQAKQYALAENKALLRVSGTRDEAATSNLVAQICQIAKTDAKFKDKFVYFFTSATSSDPDLPDGNPTIGVFLPSEAEQSGRWQYANGRLAYGYGYSTILQQTVTNDYENVGEVAHYAITNEAYIARWADSANGTVVSTNLPYSTDGLTVMTRRILAEGWSEYCRMTHDISLTVAASPTEAGEPDPAFGVYENAYTNGQVVTATALREMTNVTDVAGVITSGIVMGYNGWTLTNETTGAFQKGSGTKATFTVKSNDVLTLTWQAVTNKVWINVRDRDREGTTSPGSGWYSYGQTVTFVATPEDGYRFDQWTRDVSGKSLRHIIGGTATRQPTLSFTAVESLDLLACYMEGEAPEPSLSASNTVTVVSADIGWYELENAITGSRLTDTKLPSAKAGVFGSSSRSTVAMGGTVKLPATTVTVSLATNAFTDAKGDKWTCVGWQVYETTAETNLVAWGNGTAANTTFTANSTLQWLWKKVVKDSGSSPTPSPTPSPGGLDPAKVPLGPYGGSPLTIFPTNNGLMAVEATVTNAVKGWWYKLRVADAIDGDYSSLTATDDTDVVKKEATANGTLELRSTFAPNAGAQFYKVFVEGAKDP